MSAFTEGSDVERIHICGKCGLGPLAIGQPTDEQGETDLRYTYCCKHHGTTYSSARNALLPCDFCEAMLPESKLFVERPTEGFETHFYCTACRRKLPQELNS